MVQAPDRAGSGWRQAARGRPDRGHGAQGTGARPRHITGPGAVSLEELPLLSDDRLREALATLKQAGVTPEEYGRATDQLQPIPVTKQAHRQASRLLLDETIKTRAGRLVKDHGLNHEGRDLDTRRLGRGNWLVVKAAIDNHAATTVDRSTSERDQYSQAEIDLILERLDSIVTSVESELFNGRS